MVFYEINMENEKCDQIETIVLFTEGFEEIEGLSIVDILRRADISCKTIATKDGLIKLKHFPLE